MWKHAIWIAALFCAACGTSTSSTSTSGGTTGTNGITVTATSFKFSPATMSISTGQTVTWRNDDNIDHTVTSGTNGQPDGRFDKLLHPGDTFQFTFSQPGSYPYFCRFHFSMGMTGLVSVTAGGSSGSSGTSTGTSGTTSATTTGTTAATTTTGRTTSYLHGGARWP